MSKYTQNLSIQVIPINTSDAYSFIDQAIEVIEGSGLSYKVTAFSTQIEGQLDELQRLISQIQEKVFTAGAEEIILNIQFHAKNNEHVYLDEKTVKFN